MEHFKQIHISSGHAICSFADQGPPSGGTVTLWQSSRRGQLRCHHWEEPRVKGWTASCRCMASGTVTDAIRIIEAKLKWRLERGWPLKMIKSATLGPLQSCNCWCSRFTRTIFCFLLSLIKLSNFSFYNAGVLWSNYMGFSFFLHILKQKQHSHIPVNL